MISDSGPPVDEDQLADLLVEHEKDLLSDESRTNDKLSTTKNRHRDSGELEQAKECLKKLQAFAQQCDFPNRSKVEDPICHGASARTTEKSREHEVLNENDCPLNLPETIGRFQVLRQLGVGGFGIVFHAFDPDLNREVAIKILRPESLLVRENRIRFERESQLAAMLNHPAIVPVYETGVDGPVKFIVFGYIPGENLAQWFARCNRPVSPAIAGQIITRAADAVACAHQRGILHRDLKPANFLLETAKGEELRPEQVEGRLHVADFGLAVDLDATSSLTCTGTMVGTPVYIAPELIAGKGKPSASSDVYSLGVMLYELLTGQPPFQSESGLQMLKAIVEDAPRRLNSLGPDDSGKRFKVPRDLEAICFKCLNKNPDHRYSSAVGLHHDLLCWQNGKSVSARPVTFATQMARWASRKPWIATLLTVVAGLIVVGAIGGTWAAVELARRNSNLQNSYFNSLISESRLIRQSQTAGRRSRSIDSLKSASKLSSNDHEKILQMRNEAIASMSMLDVEPILEFPLPTAPSPRGLELAFDSELARFAFVNSRGDVSIVDATSQQELQNIAVNGRAVHQIVFLPTVDRQQLATTDSESQLVIFDNNTPRIVVESIKPDFQIDVSPSGATVVVLDVSGELKFIEVATGKTLDRITDYQTNSQIMVGAGYSPTGKRLAVWFGNQVDVWRLDETGMPHEREFRFIHTFNPKLGIISVAWAPDESRLATTTDVFTTHLWSLDWGESKHQELAGHNAWVYHAAFDPGNRLAVTSSVDGTSRYWDSHTGELLMVDQGRVMAISANGEQLAGVRDGSVVIWQKRKPGYWNLCHTSCGSEYAVAANAAASSSFDGSVLVGNSNGLALRTQATPQFSPCNEMSAVLDVVFSGDGKYGFASQFDEVVRLDRETGAKQVVYRVPENRDCGILISSLSANRDGSRVAIATCNGLELINCETGVARKIDDHPLEHGYIRFHPSRPIYAYPTAEGIAIRDVGTDEELDFYKGFRHPSRFDPKGKFLVAQKGNQAVLVNLVDHSTQSIGIPIKPWGPEDVAFTQRGMMAVCGINNSILLFDRSTGALVELARIPISTSNTWVTFGLDGDRLFYADTDQHVVELDIRQMRARLAELGFDWGRQH